MISDADFINFFVAAYQEREWPAPIKRLTGDTSALRAKARAALREPVDDNDLSRLRKTLGSLVNGQAAERAFERIYSAEMQTSEVKLVDDRTRDNLMVV